MATIGNLMFCTDCGDLLPASNDVEKSLLTCDCCGARHKAIVPKKAVSRSKPSDFPSPLRQQLQSKVQAIERDKIQTDSTTLERCPKCGREEVRYTTVQLRSADEGSTIIYHCDCGNSWHQNN